MRAFTAIALALMLTSTGCGYKGKLKTPAQIEHIKAKKARAEAKKQREAEKNAEQPDEPAEQIEE